MAKQPDILIDTKNRIFKIGDTELGFGIGFVQVTFDGEWSAVAATERPKDQRLMIRCDGDLARFKTVLESRLSSAGGGTMNE